MRKDVVVDVSAADRARLEAVVADRNSPQKHVWRARIVLLTADGVGTVEIMRRTVKSKTALSRQLPTSREGQGKSGLCCCDSILPPRRRFGSKGPQRRSGDEVALKIERVVDGGMDAEEALGGSS